MSHSPVRGSRGLAHRVAAALLATAIIAASSCSGSPFAGLDEAAGDRRAGDRRAASHAREDEAAGDRRQPSHAREAEAPAHAAPPAGVPQGIPVQRLRVEGTRFVKTDGTPFQWRGITAFRLLDQLARGREAEVTSYLDWAAAQKLTVLRVLVMAYHLFQLSPEDGRGALPRLLELAAARGLYVEIVALADTAELAVDLEQHVLAVGTIAGWHANALVEIANEPTHPTQRPEVHDPSVLLALSKLIPEAVPVALGSVDDSDAHAAGDYVTVHLSRDTGAGGWAHVTAIAAEAPLPERWKKPVVSDEPVGAAAELHEGRRDNDPARFRAAALLTRLVGFGATFHYEGGLHSEIPAGRELECFQAWNDAWRLLPGDIEHRGSFHSGGAGIVSAASGPRQLFVRRAENDAWAVLIGPGPDSGTSMAEGWQAAETQALPGATVVRAQRRPP